MIAKISRGKNTGKLLRYLYGPGRANEHTDPHLVASWDGFAPDPGRSHDPKAAHGQLTQALDLRVQQACEAAPAQHVWHCSVRATPEDRFLTDAEWAAIAHRVVSATGIAPEGDSDGCRWVAVRHADDHIHIAATTIRGDLRRARHWNDYLTADRELEAVEKDYGLHQYARGDRTAAKRPSRAETEKAQRNGHQQTAREQLRTTVRTAVSAAAGPEEFLRLLTDAEGVLVDVQYFPSGDIRGYKVALPGDTNAAGEPVYFSGSKLAPDLSYPQIRERLAATEAAPERERTNAQRPDPWHQATAAIDRIPTLLGRGEDDAAAQAHLAAFGETLDALPLRAPQDLRPQLRQAAAAFERATRSRTRSDHQHARALRGAVKDMLRQPPAKDEGTTFAMLLDAAVLVALAAARWHASRRHDQQVHAAQQTLPQLQAAYQHAAPAPLAALAQRKPPQIQSERYAKQIRQTVPTHAEQVLADSTWPALTATLAEAEEAGHRPAAMLQQALQQRSLDDARSPAQVLV